MSSWKEFSSLQKLRYKQSPGQYKGDPKSSKGISLDITYEVNLNEIFPLLDGIEEEVLVNSKSDVLDAIGESSRIIMRSETPWGERSRGAHLRDTITVEKPNSDTVEIGPNKKVDNYDLGILVHRGTKGGKIIVPVKAPYMVFYWDKIGQIVKRKKVTRGSTPPNPFIERTKSVMDKLVVGVWSSVMRRHLERLK